MPVEPITHLEKTIAGTAEPVTHLEKTIAGTVEPVTHLEKIIEQYGGGGEAVLIQKTITANGTFAAADDNADGYSSVTVDVQGSGTDYFLYARSLGDMFYIPYTETYQFPFEEISINAPLVTSISRFWSTGAFGNASQKNRGVKKISLNIKNISVTANNPAFNGTPDLEEIVINADNAYGYGEARTFLSYLPGLKKISGVTFNGNIVNWTYGTDKNVIYFPTGSALEEIRFVPNSMSYNGTYQLAQHGNLSDDSLVSIANAMDASGSVNVTKTVKLHATAAGKLSTILGTVTDGVFALDTNGTTTLLDFITQTKGWTVS
jgi:hypothetical protein